MVSRIILDLLSAALELKLRLIYFSPVCPEWNEHSDVQRNATLRPYR